MTSLSFSNGHHLQRVAESVGPGPPRRLVALLVLIALLVGCQPALDGPDQHAAAWVLARGGRVTVEAGSRQYALEPQHRLPAGPLHVTRIGWDIYPGDQNTAVTDADLAQFAELAQLRELDLWTAPISDAGLAQVGRIKSLERLQLSQTRITDAGLAHLDGLTRLKQISLVGTRVSRNALNTFRRKHPGCEVLTDKGTRG